MWKWFGGCLLLLAVLVAAAMMFGYRMMRESLSPDGAASVMIGATPSRVFASMAHGDSVGKWMARGSVVLSSRHGPLVPGDTIRIELRSPMPSARQAITWRVREVVENRLTVLELVGHPAQSVTATRRDSIESVGDSTRVVSRIESAFPDRGDTSAKAPGTTKNAPGGFAPELLLSMFRMESKLDLMLLKDHIEGTLARSKAR